MSGVRYHYYRRTPTAGGKPTLLFLHGFPSISEHWIHQITCFSNKGYGIIAPDMLGYGGTSKPVDPKEYGGLSLAAQWAAILNAEDVDKAVVIGHDWGSRVASRLANLYRERHLASIFLSVSYLPPMPATQNPAKVPFDYWKLFSSQDSPDLLAAHDDSLYTLTFTSDPSYWKYHILPEGQLKK